MTRDPDGPLVPMAFELMPEAADALERLAAIGKTSQVNMVNYVILTVEMLIDKGIVSPSVLLPYDREVT
jgi:hypothetical protein